VKIGRHLLAEMAGVLAQGLELSAELESQRGSVGMRTRWKVAEELLE